jgi:alpha-D-ribose 1-methylphosphonate 5-triphosphate synthase subunit PhnG
MMNFDRMRRADLLAEADQRLLVELADACLAGAGPPTLITGPEVGTVLMTVREPVEATRFHLGDVLVTRAEVEHRGSRGWAMRMGDDLAAALAAAICDAEVEANGPFCTDVDDLCRHTSAIRSIRRAAEWEELSATIVRFEDLAE